MLSGEFYLLSFCLDWENKMNKLKQGNLGFSVKNSYEIPAYSLREVYYTRRMQRVFCACFSADSTFVLSGSEETNIRYDIWMNFQKTKIKFNPKLGIAYIIIKNRARRRRVQSLNCIMSFTSWHKRIHFSVSAFFCVRLSKARTIFVAFRGFSRAFLPPDIGAIWFEGCDGHAGISPRFHVVNW